MWSIKDVSKVRSEFHRYMFIPAQGNKHGICEYAQVQCLLMKMIELGNPLKSVDSGEINNSSKAGLGEGP